ncbi:hypothetical protein [Actinoalloteichus spitiensis]|uniref:hypothetical protein n=1 Tax=Actinoalloteichus spitiensis TaxID=252394 RepID=UPI00037A30A1|nr:hypothetical protein [Actinoalloteichus spitiensis]
MALRDLGFTAEQERLYRALLASPDSDLTALSRPSDTPGAVRAALAGLVELGVARFRDDRPAGVELLRPSIALGDLIERTEDELLRRHRRTGDTRGEVAALDAQHAGTTAGPPAGQGVERLTDVDQVRERLAELSFFTRTSVYSVHPAARPSPESVAAARPLDVRSLRRGVEMRVIHEASVVADHRVRDHLREVAAAGARIRLSDLPVERMIIMDEEVVVVPSDPADTRRGALVVRQAGLVHGFLHLFHRLWAEAADLMTSGDPPADLTEEDRRLLALLAEGRTDETAARAVGVSVRHLRRRVARLMHRLQATSRFEAGVAAARRGWL